MRSDVSRAEWRDLVAVQDGVISRKQALQARWPSDVIDRLLRAERWQALQRGVYRVYPGEPSRAAVLWAAVHRAGRDAVLSHQTRR